MIRLRVGAIAAAHGLTLSELQRRTGLSMPLVRRYWYGTRDGSVHGRPLQQVTLPVLAQIAQALGVAPSALLDAGVEDHATLRHPAA